MKTVCKLLELLIPQERGLAAFLVGMMLVMALLDVVGVASIMPFIAVLSNPEIVNTNAFLAWLQHTLGATSGQDFLFMLGVLVFFLLLASLGFKALVTYAQVRFTLMREYTIGHRLIAGYLRQPYTWFLNRNSVELGKTVLSEVSNVVHGAMVPMMSLIAQSIVAIAMLTLLFVVDSILAIKIFAAMGAAYGIIFVLMNKFLFRIGQERFVANQRRFTAVNEAFGAVKEVKVGGLERAYARRFAVPAATYAGNHVTSYMVAQLPRYALEAFSFGGMLILILYLMARGGGLATTLPVVAVYAFAGYRLMPALQQVYASFSQLRFAGPALDALHMDLVNLPRNNSPDSTIPEMRLQKSILLKNVEFSYPHSALPSLKNIDLEIKSRSTVGLVGATGSGKTTLVDLILGLLPPQKGVIMVDGQVINAEHRRAWQKIIGYVPQQIYLTDDTVAANIAFGIDPADIDYSSVHRAARIANLHDFIMHELPDRYNTLVGERGVRLSGGQRQRIGIARALYHNPQILLLDEATSALDNLTEQAVMEAVISLRHDITIVLIAHRLSTVRLCDTIILLEKGQIKAQGTYDQLIEQDNTFKAMASI
jgi:ABC-type multidrug transport system fused ATPase/permease subunit